MKTASVPPTRHFLLNECSDVCAGIGFQQSFDEIIFFQAGRMSICSLLVDSAFSAVNGVFVDTDDLGLVNNAFPLKQWSSFANQEVSQWTDEVRVLLLGLFLLRLIFGLSVIGTNRLDPLALGRAAALLSTVSFFWES